LARDPTEEIPPTVGFNIRSIIVDQFKVNVWDVGGQKSIRSFWRNYFDTTDGLVWVVDSSDYHRLVDCRVELHNILKEERLAGASLLIMANKQDIAGSMQSDEIGRLLGVDEISRSRHCLVARCSAFDKESVVESIQWIIHDIGNRIYTLR
jgi:ADP-ribosylation factor-like protein 2